MARNNSLDMGELTDAYYYILLSLISPKHGYLIMKSVEEMSEGEFSIGPASLYTSIKKLLDAEFIELTQESEKKKVYVITDKGIESLKNELERKRKMVKIAENAFNDREML
ncbi:MULTISPECIES: PadR family transcriptional regulator [Clostridium]|uniref:PadR family transcriptional regulator n=1 Tax=Clostridium beijerinckii TaxID=1520 RepID=A0AAW3WD44_CLOBE|nr:PadR family transcriptional regulator [Clostridium beijerinckii]ALB44931.1 PadR family transcriptional regulator [Clostridium beijerinckii NRRL B-598]MBC2458893.1 PadR family transcriptional regulator [Clostridium beijerinckii]MBC2476318.1 PadR family transcriptional regulator [Clostridium beijerinckii]